MGLSESIIPGVSRAIEGLDVDVLRAAIRAEYTQVASDPAQGFHFHTGRRLAGLLGYDETWFDGVPEDTVASFAGTGNPFSLGSLGVGEHVVDVGCGAGIDSLIAARMVGASGTVVGVDMTPAMLGRARESARLGGVPNGHFFSGVGEAVARADGWAGGVVLDWVLN